MVMRWLERWLARRNDSPIQAELPDDGSSVFSKEDGFMWLFVGLGNPGDAYSKNRHNVGFMAVDAIADAHGMGGKFRKKYQGELAEGVISGAKVLLLKPQTYMNLSGESVIKAAQFYKIPVERIIVFHDELDIAPSQVRIKKGGGNAGHNGLKSMQAHLGSPDFWRVRIGIGRPQFSGDVSNYVLDNFSKTEQVWLTPLIEKITKVVDFIIDENPKAYEKKLNELLES
jgi:peptidyl-tRNA hydrolase, PTH1 family